MTSPAPLTMNIMLSIATADSNGNTGDGKYNYVFSPGLIIAIASPVTVTIQLTKDTLARFVIEDLVSTDSKFQLGAPRIDTNGRSMSIDNQNSQRCLIFMSVLVRDTVNGYLLNCDPQMTNVPEGG